MDLIRSTRSATCGRTTSRARRASSPASQSRSATIGIAFAANLLTLFLFYEALTIVDLPAGDAQGDGGGDRPAASTSCCCWALRLAVLLAIVATWVIAGTLDFTPGGILAGKAGPPLIASCSVSMCSGSARRR